MGLRHVAQALQARGCLESEHPTPDEDVRESGLRQCPPLATVRGRPEPAGLPEVERAMILRMVRECDGNLSRAARALKIPRSTLRDRLKKYGER